MDSKLPPSPPARQRRSSRRHPRKLPLVEQSYRQRRFFLSICATRSFTIFLTSAAGSGLSVGKWMVPLDVEKPFSSFLKAAITEAVGKKLQWFENAANHTSTPLCLNAGIP